jgi:hypothetical protein
MLQAAAEVPADIYVPEAPAAQAFLEVKYNRKTIKSETVCASLY